MIKDYECSAYGNMEIDLPTRENMSSQKDSFTKRDLERFIKELSNSPDPYFGRVQELKERISKKDYPPKDAIDEAAIRLAARFLGKE